ncbi:hypothetical protein MBAV_004358, partial [Candidatus Magnetobacterium bavaricum]
MSDLFGASTAQNLITGGDGAKLYEWNVLNSANATVMDVDNASGSGFSGRLCIKSSTPTADSPLTNPFVYQEVTGDFDVDIYLYAVASGGWQGLLCRCPTASAGEDYVGIVSDDVDNLYWTDFTNSSNTYGNLSSTNRYLRLTRVGDTFTAYRKLNSVDSWMPAHVFTRADFAGKTLQLGMYLKRLGGTASTQVDYFQ